MEKKGSDHFRDILNPYGEKPNYGKRFFFPIILSVTIYQYTTNVIQGNHNINKYLYLNMLYHATYVIRMAK